MQAPNQVRIGTLVLLSWLLLSGESSAHVATEEAFFPIQEGAVWTYAASLGQDKVATLTSKMTAVASVQSGQTVHMLTTTTWQTPQGESRSANEDVLYEKTSGEIRATFPNQSPDVVLKFPLVAGSTWPYKAGTAILAQEAATTPFGAFPNAVKVSAKTRGGATETRWYAPGVGLVRCEVVRPDGVRTTLELTGFTPASR